MKQSNTVTAERKIQNSMKWILRTPSMDIEISLADECKNRHNDFYMTCTIWETGKRHIDKNVSMCGSCHDEILELHPDLKIFAYLHGCNAQGVPSAPEANGFYFLKEQGAKSMADYMRTNNEQTAILAGAEDEQHFLYLIHSLGLPAQWKAEADKAIEILEDKTNCTFIDNSRKSCLSPLTDELKEDIELKISTGYYSAENKAERVKIKKALAFQSELNKIEEKMNKAIEKERIEYAIDKAVLFGGLSLDNFIYYNHSNEGVFNWNTSSYRKAVTQEQFNEFMSKVDLSGLPENITFKLK